MGLETETATRLVDEAMFDTIDALPLSPRLKREREEFFKREVEITADRAILAMESWQKTGDCTLDVRWAKLVETWAERLPVVIFKDQLVVGSETGLFRGADPYVEMEAPNVVEVMEKGKRQLRTSAARVSECTEEVWDAVEETVNFFLGKTPVDATFKSLADLYGDWPEEMERARGIRRHGRYQMACPVPIWERLLTRGLRSIINDARAGVERVQRGEEPDARKAWFWQAAVIVCEAVIHYAHRYGRLARELARFEVELTRVNELEQIADICDRVPEFPARTLHEAVQSRIIFGLAMHWCRPTHPVDESGRMDQYLYPFFMQDIKEGRITLDRAGDLLGAVLSNVARRDGVKSVQLGQYAQGTLINQVVLGGITSEGQDACNDLTYLILHMAGLQRYAEPHYTFRVSSSTPKWALMKALETNLRVAGGQPQFMSDDHVIDYMVKQGETVEDARDWAGWG